MSTGPGADAGVSAPGPATPRPLILGRLEAEYRQAVGCFEYGRAAEIKAQMDRLSAQCTAADPAREVAAAAPRPRRPRTRTKA